MRFFFYVLQTTQKTKTKKTSQASLYDLLHHETLEIDDNFKRHKAFIYCSPKLKYIFLHKWILLRNAVEKRWWIKKKPRRYKCFSRRLYFLDKWHTIVICSILWCINEGINQVINLPTYNTIFNYNFDCILFYDLCSHVKLTDNRDSGKCLSFELFELFKCGYQRS